MVSVEQLVEALREESITSSMVAREEDFEKLFKNASKASSEHEEQTLQMIELLHKMKEQVLFLNSTSWEPEENGFR